MLKLIRFVSIIALLGALVAANAQKEPSKERILLTFIPNIQFAPFYLGIERGNFAEAGYDLTLEHLQEPEVLDLVAVGRANFGIVSGEQVILARAQGRDVVYVFEWFQQYPVGLVFDSAVDLGALDNLRGMKVGIPGRFGASYSGLTTLLQSAGLTEDDIEVNEIGFNAPEVFCLGAVDAAIVYVNNEPLQIRNLASTGDCGAIADVDVVTVASQVDLVSNGLIVSRDQFENDPESVQRMVSGLRAALQAAINNPALAYLDSMKYVEGLADDESLIQELESVAERQREFLSSSPDRASIASSRQQLGADLAERFEPATLTQFNVLLSTIELWDADRLGYSDLQSWRAMRDTLELLGFLEGGESDLEQAFSNRFVASDDE